MDALLPARCHGCGVPISDGDPVCVCLQCRLALRPSPSPRCSRCDHPARFAIENCPGCETLPDILVRIRSAVALHPPAGELVHALKYEGWTGVGDLLVSRMTPLVPVDAAALVPVPSPPGRERRRGYNPARVLAAEIAERSGIPLLDALLRPRESPRQVGLSPDRRATNVRGVFVPAPGDSRAVRGAHIVLVDDVLTTGATASEAALTLGGSGASAVTLVTFARAVPALPDGSDAS